MSICPFVGVVPPRAGEEDGAQQEGRYRDLDRDRQFLMGRLRDRFRSMFLLRRVLQRFDNPGRKPFEWVIGSRLPEGDGAVQPPVSAVLPLFFLRRVLAYPDDLATAYEALL